jgi:Radical SAM superfamily
MRVLYATLPGRFPTVTYDPGSWWDIITSEGGHSVTAHSLNHDWWRLVMSPTFVRLILAPLSAPDSRHRRIAWRINGLDVECAASRAEASLGRLKDRDTYRSQVDYIAALSPIATYLDVINRVQSEFHIDVDVGPRVRDLDYTDSRTLVGYALGPSLLARTVEAAVDLVRSDSDVVLFSVCSPEDLLTGLITARVMRDRRPGTHISLIDHGYENFSLSGSIESLRATGALTGVFNTIIASKDERDETVPALLDAIARGASPAGIIGRRDVRVPRRQSERDGKSFPPLPTFAPEPILWTRVSKRRCYWSRCTFCTQNAKFTGSKAPTHGEILANLDRIATYARSGYQKFMFSDEAISPSSLALLAEAISRRGLEIRWACRSKLERAHTPELFRQLRKAGCFEILFGIESVVPRILGLMDKVADGIDEAHVSGAFRAMTESGIGVHVTLIAAFPGETLVELRQTVAFIATALATSGGATFALNQFELLAETPIARSPNRFGIRNVGVPGDVAAPLSYELASHLAAEGASVLAAMADIREELDTALGWSQIEGQPGGALARHLYFYSGHGAIFKSREDNPFGTILRAARRAASSVSAADGTERLPVELAE